MANNFQDVQQGAIQLIDTIKREVKGLDEQVKQLNDNVKKLTTSGGITPQKTVDQIKALEAEMTKLNSVIKKQTTQIERLKEARKKENVEIKSAVPNLQKLKKFKDDENASNNRAIKTYSQLIAKHRQVKKALQDAIVAHGKNSREVKKATIAYDKYNRKVLQAQKATSNFAKRGLKSSFRGLRNLIGAFGIIGGATMIAGFTKEVFNVTKKLQSLDFALKAVVATQEEFIRVQAFLSDISNNFGANIVTTTERYTKFLAAAKQSNVSMEDTEKIFRTVTKASGVLGLKTDELTGIYLALEQMLSKGKVTTEELRRQLGERLPGAFGIMADAIGVNTRELDKMLRAGEILSAEALPKFAKQLEKAYGIESVTKIDTLVAAQQRLSNEWVEFIRSLDSGSGIITKVFSTLLDFASSVVSVFKEINQGVGGLNNRVFEDIYENTKKYYEDLSDFETQRIQMIKTSLEFDKLSVQERKKLEKELTDFKKLQQNEANAIANKRKQNAQVEISNLGFQEHQIRKTQKAYLDAVKSGEKPLINATQFEKNKDTLDEISTSLSRQNAALKASNDFLNQNTEELNENKNAGEGVAETKRELQILSNMGVENANNETLAIFRLKKALEEQVKEYEKYIKLFPKGSRDAQVYIDKVRDLKIALGEITAGDLINVDGALKDINKFFENNDFTNAIKPPDEAKDKWKDTFTNIVNLATQAFGIVTQLSDASFERQFANLEKQKEVSLAFAGDSAEAREEIERQYEEKRKVIQRRQAKAKKEQAIFEIALDTASAVVQALPNVPLSIAIGALGAIQLGLVAAQPIPEFFRGTMNAPEGMALVDEKQPEVHTDRNGNIKSFGESGANYRWLSSGDKIYKSHDEYFEKELSNVLSVNDVLPYREALSTSSPVINVSNGLKKEVFVREIRSMRNDLMSKETSVTRIDKNGFYTGVRKNGAEIERQNNILKLKGGIV
tara:strand:- start:5939 stop:8818 length:2880 start_codon:yes stop_codon:yes gene_type:complete